ncbi:MAG: FkbM family methyltransferase [Ahniella sp.]|nr:FkbM family methyltransferase [Ahniella sp.]
MAPTSSAPVHVIPAAVSQSVDLKTLNIAARSRSSNALAGHGSSQAGGVSEQQKVISISLDWLAGHFPDPDVIKIDIEGAEFEALAGAVTVLKRKRPLILCEVASTNSAQVGSLLLSMDYKILDGEVPTAQRTELSEAPWATVAIPPA